MTCQSEVVAIGGCGDVDATEDDNVIPEDQLRDMLPSESSEPNQETSQGQPCRHRYYEDSPPFSELAAGQRDPQWTPASLQAYPNDLREDDAASSHQELNQAAHAGNSATKQQYRHSIQQGVMLSEMHEDGEHFSEDPQSDTEQSAASEIAHNEYINEDSPNNAGKANTYGVPEQAQSAHGRPNFISVDHQDTLQNDNHEDMSDSASACSGGRSDLDEAHNDQVIESQAIQSASPRPPSLPATIAGHRHIGRYSRFQVPQSLLRPSSQFPQLRLRNRPATSITGQHVGQPVDGSSAQETPTLTAKPHQHQVQLSPQHAYRTQYEHQPQYECQSRNQPTLQTDSAESDIASLTKEFINGINQHEQASATRFAAGRKAWETEKLQMCNTEQALRDQIRDLQQDQRALSETVESQQTRLADFGSKASKFKTFVDGLGKDIDTLKREATVNRQRTDQLASEAANHREAQDTLLEQMSGCAEKTVQLEHKALRACRDAKAELDTVILRSTHLEHQLHDKSKQLVREEKLHMQTQAQLRSTTSSNDVIVRTLKSNNDAILDKLYEIHAELQEANNHEKVVEMLEKMHAAVQGLDSKDVATAEDVSAVSGLLERLSQAISKSFQSSEELSSQETLFKAHLDQSLRSLKAELCDQQTLIAREAADRVTIAALREKLGAKDAQISDVESQLASMSVREKDLGKENEAFRSRVHELQSQVTSSAEREAQLGALNLELHDKAAALDICQTSLADKLDELRALNENNVSLQEDLRQSADEASAAFAENTTLKLDFEQKTRDALDQAKKEWQRDANQVRADLEAEHANNLASIMNDLRKTTTDGTPISNEFAEAKASLEEKTQEAAKISAALEESRQIASELRREADNLKADVSVRESAWKAAEENIAFLRSQLNEQDTRAERAGQELREQVEEFRRVTNEARSGEKRAVDELEKERATQESATQQLQLQIEEAKRKCSGELSQHQEDFQKTLNSEMSQATKQIEELRKQLAQSEQEARDKQEQDHEHQAQVDQKWKTLNNDHAKQVTELNARIAEAEAQRDEALTDANHLREELTSRRMAAACQDSAFNSAFDRQETQPALQKRNSKTPASSSQGKTAAQPAKPRKRVDRSSGLSVVNVNAIPAPGILRFSSTRGAATNSPGVVRGPEVEESQFEISMEMSPIRSPGPTMEESMNALGQHPTAGDIDLEELGACKLTSPERGAVVEETQQENLAPFAKFKVYGSTHMPSTEESIFRKPMPAPNSGSKLMRLYSESSSQGSRGLGSRHYELPSTRCATPVEESVARSSSPAFMSQLSQSQPPTSQANKQGPIERSPSKRKLDRQVVEGNEPERKKCKSSSRPAAAMLRLNNSRQSASTQTRTAAVSRGKRKKSSQDLYVERFSRELRSSQR